MIALTATVATPALDAAIHGFEQRLQAAVTATAKAVQDRYEQEAPRDTGSMALGIYIHTADGETDYGERTALADAVNPKVVIQEQLPSPPAPGAVVGVSAEHGFYVEHGTTRMPPRPVFTASVEAERQPFKVRVAQAMVP